MKCPDCNNQLTSKRWFLKNIYGGWIIGEILLLLISIPLLIVGPIGWVVLGVIIAALITYGWGRRVYKCKECGYKTIIKLNGTTHNKTL